MEAFPKPIVCAHADAERTGQACEHLLKKATDEFYASAEHFLYFTGSGTELVLICPECARQSHYGKAHWRTICDYCVQDIACGTRVGELGTLGFPSRDIGIALSHKMAGALTKTIAAACPIGNRPDGRWLFVTTDCELAILNPADGSQKRIGLPVPKDLEREQLFTLCTSNNGRFATVANTFGRHGIVIDLERECVTMTLVRGDYYNEHCKFPVAFAEHGAEQLVVHATDWNRLDISDASSGRLLTPRQPTSYREGQDLPAHYLDYFQCSLSVSPTSDWIASNGWVWHPLGYVAAWSIPRWLKDNVWESEDGPTKKALCRRDYYWDGPLCWINGDTVAIWGLGDDDILLVPGVRIFDVRTGEETHSVAGPVGGSIKTTMRVKGKEQHFRVSAGSLVFDRWLFSWKEGKPFSIWDLRDGARLLENPDFTPIGYHRGTKEFLSQLPDGTICISYIRASA